MMTPIKGEIWLVNLMPIVGHEQDKARPCVVISNDQVNTKLEISIVVPLTGVPRYTQSGKLSPSMVEILPPEGGVTKTSYSLAHQVRTISHLRFKKKLGSLTASKLKEIVVSVQEVIEH
jgi:mRNA interferase MazF